MFAFEVWCTADVSSVSPSSEETENSSSEKHVSSIISHSRPVVRAVAFYKFKSSVFHGYHRYKFNYWALRSDAFLRYSNANVVTANLPAATLSLQSETISNSTHNIPKQFLHQAQLLSFRKITCKPCYSVSCF